MNNSYAVFLGDVAQDEYYKVERWPTTADKVSARMLDRQMGGMIANAASVYASYGGKTYFSGILNPNDRCLCNDLSKAGINTDLVIYDTSIKDSKCLIFLSEGEHTVFIVDTEMESMPITEQMQAKYCGASVIYSGYWQLNCMHMVGMDSASIVKQWYCSGVQLVIDADVDKLTDEDKVYLPYTHILFMNETGFCNQRDGRSDEETVRYLLGFGLKILVVTLASHGCIIYTNSDAVRIPGVPATVADVTGAGDTFCSTFTYFYSLSNDIELSARFAMNAASRSVTQMGARGGAVGIAPVLDYISAHGEDTSAYLAWLLPSQNGSVSG